MKKKLIFVLAIILLYAVHSLNAQVYSPQLVGHFGPRIIYYPYGYYQGNVNNGIAHGLGTFYFSDGSFYRGNFLNGWWHGEGVIVSPYQGYLAGCWSKGQYVGNCSANNQFNNSNRVQEIVSDIQSEKPNNKNYADVSPEGYKIKRIDPNTKMGKSLLGKYTGK